MTKQDKLYPSDDQSGKLNSQRNYGIDLLRMLAMYMVCLLHTLGCGGILYNTNGPAKLCIVWFFETAAYCAVNCFALISGYVGVKSKFKYRNLLRLWMQAFFYNVGISLIFYFVKPGSVSAIELIKACFPICTKAYWYLTAYAVMFFSIPQLNFILERQDKKDVKIFLWIFFILLSLCSLPPIIMGITDFVNTGHSAIWLAYLYLIGGFIRLYGIGELFRLSPECKYDKVLSNLVQTAFGSQCWRIAIYAICVIVAFFIRTGAHYLAERFFDEDPYFTQYLRYNSPLILLAGIALLDIFSHLQLPRWSAFIRFASPLAFSVYLIQNQKQVWELLFTGAFTKCTELPSVVLLFSIIAISLAIYTVCSLIDYVRLRLFRLFG